MVPVVDLSRRGARFAAAFGAGCDELARSGSFLLGAHLDRFEREFAAAMGSPDAVAVSSGAAALQLGLAALDIGPGDEVIVPAFTAVPTATAVAAVGATPVFVDVDAATACLDPLLVGGSMTDRTKAVIVVHLYGFPGVLPDVPVPVVGDAAQAHGALDHTGREAFTAYSFYPTKNLGGIGDGGAVVTHRDDLADRVRTRRVHGMSQQYLHEVVSQNFRMSEVEAMWLELVLPALADDTARRRSIAQRYRIAAPHLRWQRSHERHVMHLCVFRTTERERCRGQLAGSGVSTAIHYPLSLPEQPAFADLPAADCPEAAAWAAECVTVPCFPEMTDDEVDLVAGALAELAP